MYKMRLSHASKYLYEQYRVYRIKIESLQKKIFANYHSVNFMYKRMLSTDREWISRTEIMSAVGDRSRGRWHCHRKDKDRRFRTHGRVQ